MVTPVHKAIWYIESHFADAVTLDHLARLTGLSRFQMSRLFHHVTGHTVTGYLRKRRLAEAAKALAAGAPDILALALDAHYSSNEAFTRAFRDEFGLSPTEVRARGSVAGLPLLAPLRGTLPPPVTLEPPRLVNRGALLLAGLGRRFDWGELGGIPALWQTLHPHLGHVAGQVGAVAYGVVAEAAEGASCHYLAAVEVSDLSDRDDGLARMRIPARRWAVFEHDGHVAAIGSTIHAIFATALPEAGLVPIEEPDLIERYGPGFDPASGHGDVEVWVPVR